MAYVKVGPPRCWWCGLESKDVRPLSGKADDPRVCASCFVALDGLRERVRVGKGVG